MLALLQGNISHFWDGHYTLLLLLHLLRQHHNSMHSLSMRTASTASLPGAAELPLQPLRGGGHHLLGGPFKG